MKTIVNSLFCLIHPQRYRSSGALTSGLTYSLQIYRSSGALTKVLTFNLQRYYAFGAESLLFKQCNSSVQKLKSGDFGIYCLIAINQ